MSVRTRFAPSPTGRLHVGNARIAVLNWLIARHHGGAFVLRIEDTDAERNVAGAEGRILEDLRWLGLDWDEGPLETGESWGEYGPYRQSERTDLYREAADRLLAAGMAYRCFCTAEELETRRQAAIERGESAHYDGACRRMTDVERERAETEGRASALRFTVPEDGAVEVSDVVRGTIEVDAAELGDFVILRSDDRPTYNFAVVVDDLRMRISHVIRGVGHLSNAPRQVLLFDALDAEPPVFAHVPMVLGPDGQKLSKRHGARAVADYRAEGYHPDAIVNALSLLGWSSPSGDAVLSRERLVREISLDRIRDADAVFDADKLRHLSAQHIAAMELPELADTLRNWIDADRYPLRPEAFEPTIATLRSRLATFGDINEHLDAFVAPAGSATAAERAAAVEHRGGTAVVEEARTRFQQLETWSEPELKRALTEAGDAAGVRGRDLYQPVRIAVTGEAHGPSLTAVLFALGPDAVPKLLAEALRDEVAT